MRTSRRKITSAEEAERLLEELRDSGEDPPTFCQRRGLDGRSLNCWRLNLERRLETGRRRATGAETLRIVEVGWPPAVSLPADGRGEATAGHGEGRYRVTLGDVVIEVGDGFREETLYRLLSVVRAC